MSVIFYDFKCLFDRKQLILRASVLQNDRSPRAKTTRVDPANGTSRYENHKSAFLTTTKHTTHVSEAIPVFDLAAVLGDG